MKFAKELEEELVPEWRAKYFDYKQGKKKIKAVTRAIRNAQRSTNTPSLRSGKQRTTPIRRALQSSVLDSRVVNRRASDSGAQEPDGNTSGRLDATHTSNGGATGAMQVPKSGNVDHSSDKNTQDRQYTRPPHITRYGSIIGSPPSPEPLSRLATLNLPGPALDVESSRTILPNEPSILRPRRYQSDTGVSNSDDKRPQSAYEVGHTRHPPLDPLKAVPRNLKRLGQLARGHTFQSTTSNKPLLTELFSSSVYITAQGRAKDVPMEALEMVDAKKAEFQMFLEHELQKIERFYKEKEDQSTLRLDALKEQLYIMREEHLKELGDREVRHDHDPGKQNSQANGHAATIDAHSKSHERPFDNHSHHMLPGRELIHYSKQATKQVQIRRLHKANYQTTSENLNPSGDFQRKLEFEDVPYQKAKRKLKAALQEFYRGLELLKAYALLNRTAFRKINKKYDKAAREKPAMKFVFERVNGAYFVTSNTVETYLASVEDLYARYFEKGNHKVAVNKLRKKLQRMGDVTGSSFRAGVMATAGVVLGVQGLVNAAKCLANSNSSLKAHTSFLLQIYGGYSAFLLLMLLFCVVCKIFKDCKVNYAFVFEFDTRHNIDWWQLSEIPCGCLLLLGLTIFFNFLHSDNPGNFPGWYSMYVYWPVILIGLTLAILFFPGPILYHESRKWFLVTIWRLFCAGLYPVEFRDFFIGDMFCSQAFAMGNIELFFCLYKNNWNNPNQCNSSHSRLLGFFACLPGIWRLMQCIRRYIDTRQGFPHLANGGKYACTILYYAFLSAYRIHRATPFKALFIVFASTNSVYCILWDIVMDWSLLTIGMDPPLLRRQRAYKSAWPYYLAMIIDIILRFNWIPYVTFPLDSQHSTLLSYMIAVSEICRRAVWTIFRVENEHCTNVGRFRASRDVPLPYKLAPMQMGDYQRRTGLGPDEQKGGSRNTSLTNSPLSYKTPRHSGLHRSPIEPVSTSQTTGADLERVATHESAISSLRRRQTQDQAASASPSIRQRVGTLLHIAHAQDFQRKQNADDEDDAAEEEDSEDEDEVDYHEDMTSVRDQEDIEHYRHKKKDENVTVEEEDGDHDTNNGGNAGSTRSRARSDVTQIA